MTAAMAAEGGTTAAAANYAATSIFDTILCNGISKILIPLLYVFMCLSIARCATEHDAITELKKGIKWLITWALKISLYIFTGYLTITGIVSGSVDASTLKAAKIAISGSVPVVGSIISDASEAILVSAGVMKNAAGMYGILAFIAMFLSTFLTIGLQHILLRITAGICSMFSSKKAVDLILDFSTIMGFLLAMTGTICLLHLISTVCFMKGVT
jgi:stage III sporulation protein AE